MQRAGNFHYIYFAMDFGKNILEKYGWKEGDGLGKDSNGMTKPLRPSYKFDTQGLGADPSEEFNNNWWERTFNEASKNINIQKDGDKVSITVDGSTEITTKSYSVSKLKDNMKGKKYKNFLKSSILSNSNEVAEKNHVDMDSLKLPEIAVLNDNDLVAACGGRTAHKGARHGLTLSGKLARIKEQDEKMLALLNKTNETSTSNQNKDDEPKEDLGNEDSIPKMSTSRERRERKHFNKLSIRIDSLSLENFEKKAEDIQTEKTEKLSKKRSKGRKRKHLDEVKKDEDETEKGKPEIEKTETENDKTETVKDKTETQKDKIENLLSTTDYRKGETKTKRKKQNKIYNELSQIIVGLNIENDSTEKPETIIEKIKPVEPCIQVKKKKRKKNKNKDSFETNRYQALVNELTDSDLEANSSRKDPVHKIKATESLSSAKALKKKKKQKKKLKGIVLEDCDVVIT